MSDTTTGVHRATLTGLAVGDALGMPFETMTASAVKKAWDGKKFLASEYHGLRPGQWTDDTALSIAVAEWLVDPPVKADEEREDVARRMRAAMEQHPHGFGKARDSFESAKLTAGEI